MPSKKLTVVLKIDVSQPLFALKKLHKRLEKLGVVETHTIPLRVATPYWVRD